MAASALLYSLLFLWEERIIQEVAAVAKLEFKTRRIPIKRNWRRRKFLVLELNKIIGFVFCLFYSSWPVGFSSYLLNLICFWFGFIGFIWFLLIWGNFRKIEKKYFIILFNLTENFLCQSNCFASFLILVRSRVFWFGGICVGNYFGKFWIFLVSSLKYFLVLKINFQGWPKKNSVADPK